MNKIGLDFGTTNSTLSYLDASGNVKCYRLGGASASEYIPSFIAYAREDEETVIGKEAKLSQTEEEYEVYSKFKMLLGEKNAERLKAHLFDARTPAQCAHDFIRHLFHQYCREEKIKGGIRKAVITVPEIWTKEVHENEIGYIARGELRKIADELEVPSLRLLSEPVAASAYFAHCHDQRQGRPFNGHVLVCDYGGGTLDLSLSAVRGERISVLECTGKGHDPDKIGKAGVAFDETVVRAVYEREKQAKLSRSGQEFHQLMMAFESQKIGRKNHVDKGLKNYIRRASADKKVFSVDGLKINASDLCQNFDTVIKPDFMRALTEMRGYFDAHGADCHNRERFRVVPVGGFSAFYLVRRALSEFFDSDPDEDDPRFDPCFGIEDTALAISKGAALVANDRVHIDLCCPMSMGMQVIRQHDVGRWEPDDIAVLKKGVRITEYAEPQFLPSPVSISVEPGFRDTPIILFFGDAQGRRYIRLDHSIDQVFPNLNVQNNTWKVGFSVDRNFNFTMHVRDRQGASRQTYIGDLLEKINGIIMDGNTDG